ncbi:MAG TPA: GMC family oxidoreductase N-terminal domain-containing protein, partial [Solirubrobacteraceae bacterium]|nr:GMC family oxidoreductase N-terminal domain-containing protein [Solirubrobacteraceae bacterium]
MYDYVIVGAGSAGCVLANRLSEDPDVSVCLVEAGPPDTEEGLHIPVAFSQLYKTPFDWDFESEPEPALDGRNVYLPRGRVLGGSSSLNAMIYIRGNRRDYDEWRDLGNAGWGWDDVLPYFKRAEDNERGASEYHGAGGPLSVSDSHSMHPLADAFVAAAAATGLDTRDDFNTGEQDGVGRYQMTQRDGMRCSTAVAYLHPALTRPNLELIPMAFVTRVLFEGARASGVEAVVDGKPLELQAQREVILSAGAYQSPQLLMLSGIGPADELGALGIDVRLDQPAVGGNLQDHLNAGIILFTDDPTTLETAETEENVALLQTQGRGPLTSNIAESGGFWRSRDGLDAPDVQFHFAPVMFAEEGLLDPFDHAYSYGACVVKPSARGRVSLRSADPADKPRILTNFLGTEEDWAVQVAGIRKCLEIREQSPLKGYERAPYEVPDSDDDEAIRAHVRAKGHHLYHPVGTCAMGSVVDAELRVRGVEGLRVVDASVMPTLTRGNTNAPTIMIAEKASDLVRGAVPAAEAAATA